VCFSLRELHNTELSSNLSESGKSLKRELSVANLKKWGISVGQKSLLGDKAWLK